MSLTVSTTSLSAEEQEQLQQTIEMFEVIVQASPQDTQSLEILKDAYTRLGKPESLTVARRLADTYRELGQLSQALLEYENLLQRDSTNMEVIAAIGEVEEKLEKSGKKVGAAPTGPIKLDFGAVAGRPVTTIPGEPGTLITTNQTQRYEGPAGPGSSKKLDREGSLDESNEHLGKFLTQNRLVSEEVVVSALERISKKNKTRKQNQLSMSLIDEICRRGSIDLDQLLSGMLDRSKFAYIPLEYYEVDRAIVKMLPEEITMARLIVPFDVMSRTLMIAMANPFDAEGKETVQQQLDYNIQWHLASPEAINKVLAETYRIQNPSANGSELRLA